MVDEQPAAGGDRAHGLRTAPGEDVTGGAGFVGQQAHGEGPVPTVDTIERRAGEVEATVRFGDGHHPQPAPRGEHADAAALELGGRRFGLVHVDGARAEGLEPVLQADVLGDGCPALPAAGPEGLGHPPRQLRRSLLAQARGRQRQVEAALRGIGLEAGGVESGDGSRQLVDDVPWRPAMAITSPRATILASMQYPSCSSSCSACRKSRSVQGRSPRRACTIARLWTTSAAKRARWAPR